MAEGYVQSSRDERPSIDSLFRIFSHPRRRMLLRRLVGRPLPTRTAELARAIAISEGHRPEERTFDAKRAAVESSLVHVHLPMLQEAGMVDWHPGTESVSISSVASRMPILSHLEDSRLQAAFFGTDE